MAINTDVRISNDVIRNIILPYTITSDEYKQSQFIKYIIKLFFTTFNISENYIAQFEKLNTFTDTKYVELKFNNAYIFDNSKYDELYRSLKINLIVSMENDNVIEFSFAIGRASKSNFSSTFDYVFTKERCVKRMKYLKIEVNKKINKRICEKIDTYLTVPFSDKDKVKQFGARWDSSECKWYANRFYLNSYNYDLLINTYHAGNYNLNSKGYYVKNQKQCITFSEYLERKYS